LAEKEKTILQLLEKILQNQWEQCPNGSNKVYSSGKPCKQTILTLLAEAEAISIQVRISLQKLTMIGLNVASVIGSLMLRQQRGTFHHVNRSINKI